MTDEQRKRLSVLIGEIESILNDSPVRHEVYFDVECLSAGTMNDRDRVVHRIELHVTRAEIVRAKVVHREGGE